MKSNMKSLLKVIFIAIFMSVSQYSQAWQRLAYSTSYDNGFNPSIKVSPQNGSNKTITSIVFIIVSHRQGASQFDTSSFDYQYQTISTNIAPNSSRTINLTPRLKNNYKLSDVFVEKVRYSDGTIKEY